MNTVSHIYTTVSEGKIHIAADTKYIGSVDSYNNFLTKFVSWLSGSSMTVNFDGKTYSVNAESYKRLLQGLKGVANVTDVASHSLFRPIAESCTLPKGDLKMRDVIAIEDRQALFETLALAIAGGNTTTAMAAIGEGAELDTPYYDRSNRIPSFGNETAGLDAHSPYTFTVFHATPLLQAARKGNKVVCQFLEQAGANTSILGKQYVFERKVVGVDQRLEWTPEIRWEKHHHHTKDPWGHCHEHVEHKPEIGHRLENRVYVNTRDTRAKEQRYQYNAWQSSITPA